MSTFFINQIRIKIVHMTGGAFQFNQKIRQFQYGDKLYGNFPEKKLELSYFRKGPFYRKFRRGKSSGLDFRERNFA